MEEQDERAVGAPLTRDEADRMVVDVIGAHAEALLRTARRYSYCHDDAQDAYQRALEIFVTRAPRLDPDRVVGWVHTVCRHEALAVRAKRSELVAHDEVDFEREEAREQPSPEEHVLSHERIAQTAEALQRLKPQEVQALWHKALGKSYDEIATDLGWTYTKVNRCLTEGRRALAQRFAGIESGAECERWAPTLSALVDGEASRSDLAALRPHLRNCAACRAAVREMHVQTQAVAALLPPVAVTAHETPVGDAPGLLARLYETAATFIGERAAISAIKLQSAADLVAGGKVAAMAASAAAVAGGSAVVAEHATPDPPAKRETVTRVVGATPASAPAGLAPVAVSLREARRVASPRERPAVRTTGAPKRRRTAEFGRARASSSPSREFGRKRAATASTSSGTREFRAGAATTATSTSASTAGTPAATSRSFESSAATPTRRSSTPTGTGRTQSGAEFGF